MNKTLVEFKREGETVHQSYSLDYIPRHGEEVYLLKWPDSRYIVDSVVHFVGRGHDVHNVVVNLVLR